MNRSIFALDHDSRDFPDTSNLVPRLSPERKTLLEQSRERHALAQKHEKHCGPEWALAECVHDGNYESNDKD